jgi:DNA-binding PadR family transcriptional regulator
MRDPDLHEDAMSKLGEFEMLVLLSILRQRRTPYANQVRADLEENAGRAVTRGALYRTLDRLTEKGFVAWDMVPSDVPERGGHPMRRLSVTRAGVEAVRSTRNVLATFMEGLGPILDPL